ncbi:hypothetical protein AHAS_Ahas10G0184200 [Arachis hypogaea]
MGACFYMAGNRATCLCILWPNPQHAEGCSLCAGGASGRRIDKLSCLILVAAQTAAPLLLYISVISVQKMHIISRLNSLAIVVWNMISFSNS